MSLLKIWPAVQLASLSHEIQSVVLWTLKQEHSKRCTIICLHPHTLHSQKGNYLHFTAFLFLCVFAFWSAWFEVQLSCITRPPEYEANVRFLFCRLWTLALRSVASQENRGSQEIEQALTRVCEYAQIAIVDKLWCYSNLWIGFKWRATCGHYDCRLLLANTKHSFKKEMAWIEFSILGF